MKILLVAPVYLNLYKIIKEELVAEGHSVVYFQKVCYRGIPIIGIRIL